MKFIFVIPDMSWLYDYKAQFSLGILYLSTILKKDGWDVEVYDSNVKDIENIPYAHVYGFSIVHNTYPNCIKLATSIRSQYPSSLIIAGGVHATLNKKIHSIFDIAFRGEAEDTIRTFTQDFKNGSEADEYTSTQPVSLDNILPDRGLLPDEYIRTSSIFNKMSYDSNGSTSIMFSRGCPYKCTFCASPQIYDRKVRFRPVDSIVREIQHIIDTYGIRQFRVQDDTFTVKPSYLKELSEKLQNLNIYYRCSTRVNHVTDETVKYLYDSGCREIGIGIEVADDVVLQKLQKQITVAQAEEAIKCIKKYPITLRCFFMIGTPYDSYEIFEKDKDFIERNKIDFAMFANFIPFPGTDMHTNMANYNIKTIKEQTCMNLASHIPLSPNILRTDMSEEEHLKIMQVFYDYLLAKGFIS